MMLSGPEETRKSINAAFEDLIEKITHDDPSSHEDLQNAFLNKIENIIKNSELEQTINLDDFYLDKLGDVDCQIALNGIAELQKKWQVQFIDLPTNPLQKFKYTPVHQQKIEKSPNLKTDVEIIGLVHQESPDELEEYLSACAKQWTTSWFDLTSKKDSKNNTALHYIAENGNKKLWDVASKSRHYRGLGFTRATSWEPEIMFNFLALNSKGQSPLDVAVTAGNLKIVEQMKPIYQRIDAVKYTDLYFKDLIAQTKNNQVRKYTLEEARDVAMSTFDYLSIPKNQELLNTKGIFRLAGDEATKQPIIDHILNNGHLMDLNFEVHDYIASMKTTLKNSTLIDPNDPLVIQFRDAIAGAKDKDEAAKVIEHFIDTLMDSKDQQKMYLAEIIYKYIQISKMVSLNEQVNLMTSKNMAIAGLGPFLKDEISKEHLNVPPNTPPLAMMQLETQKQNTYNNACAAAIVSDSYDLPFEKHYAKQLAEKSIESIQKELDSLNVMIKTVKEQVRKQEELIDKEEREINQFKKQIESYPQEGTEAKEAMLAVEELEKQHHKVLAFNHNLKTSCSELLNQQAELTSTLSKLKATVQDRPEPRRNKP